MKIKLVQVCLFFLLACAVLQTGNAQSKSTAHMAKAQKSGDFSYALLSEEWAARYWDKDFLVAFKKFPVKNDYAAALFDETGNISVGATLWMPGARELVMEAAAATKDQRLVMAGRFISEDGAFADFVAESDNKGNLRKIVRTTPVVPRMICSVGENVWAFARNRDLEEKGVSYPLLYEYSFDRGLLFSALDSKTVPPEMGGEQAQLVFRCNEDRVVLLMRPLQQVVQIDVATHKVTTTKYKGMTDPISVTGIALTESDDLYVSVVSPIGDTKNGDAGLGVFHFDVAADGSGSWSPVPETVGSLRDDGHPLLRVLGNQGNQLVYQKKNRRDTNLSWASITVTP